MNLLYKLILGAVPLIATNALGQNPVSFGTTNSTNNLIVTEQVSEKKAEFKFICQDNTHDFGTIPEGPEAVYEFQFVNTGDAPLIISNAQASCGCTSPEFSRTPILPGKKGKIKVTYTTKGHVGNFNKSIYLSSNAQTTDGNGHFELIIKGIVIAAQK